MTQSTASCVPRSPSVLLFSRLGRSDKWMHCSRWNSLALVGVVLFASLGSALGYGQSAHLAAGARVFLGSGFNAPQAAAVDASGNVFVADTGHSAVKEILAPNYTTTIPIAVVNGNFSSPDALAIDAAGNLFVADWDNGTVKEITATSGYVAVSTVAAGFSLPTGVAVDQFENLFVADFGTNRLYEQLAVNGYATRITLNASFSALTGVAVDANENLFTADENDGIQELTDASGYSSLVNLASGNQNIVEPYAIRVDSSGNVFFTDLALGQAAEIFASGGYSNLVPVLSGLNEPTGIAVDKNGNVFVADPNNGNGTIDELPAATPIVGFGTVPIATGTPPATTLTFSFDAGGIIQAPVVLTQGAAGLDFQKTAGSCAAGNHSPGGTCTVTVSFTPRYAGLRIGAVELLNSSGAPIVTVDVYGTGSGPQIAFSPAVQTALGSGFSAPAGVAADGAGNVFVADTGNDAVKEILVSGAYAAVRTLGSGFSAPQGVAVDGAGNIFVADTGNSSVKELTAADGYTIATTLGSGFNAPTAMSVDGRGNVYVADTGNSAVKEMLALGGYTTINTLPSNTIAPSNTQANVNGNLYIADAASNSVLKQDESTPPSLTFAATAVGSTNTDSPQTVTVANIGNAALNILIPAAGNNPSIANGFTLGSGTCPVLTTSSSSAFSLDTGNSCTYLVDFAPTSGGSNTGALLLTDDNLNAALPAGTTQSIGLSGAAQSSQTISFSPPASPVTFGTSPIPLTASATSGLTVSLSVLSGPGTINGNVLTVTGAGTIVIAADQAGNASYAPAAEVQRSVVVNRATPAITWTAPASIIYGTALSAVQLNATASVAGNMTYTAAPTGGSATTVSSGSVLTAGTYTLTATFTPTDTTDFASATDSVSLTVNPATAVISALSPAYASVDGAAFTLTVTGTNFTVGETVYWGSTALTTTYVSATQLTAVVTATQIASEGIATLSVLSSNGSFSNTLAFAIITASATAPTFTTTTATVSAGTAATYSVTLPTTAGGVAVICLNLPTGASCSYSSTTKAVTIATSSDTPAGSYRVTVVFDEAVMTTATAGILLPILLLPLLLVRKNLKSRGAWFSACLGLILLAGSIFSVGCGGNTKTVSTATTQVTSAGVVTLVVQ